jgi:glycosyltransferase involved in cell wall biosynthesis
MLLKDSGRRGPHLPENRQAAQSMKRVLIIAYLFPPVAGIGIAGAQRLAKFAKYLPRHDWEPVILTVRETCYESYLDTDPALLDKTPPGITIIRTSVIRWLTRLLTLRSKLLRRDPATRASPRKTEQHSQNTRWYQSLKDSITDLFQIPDDKIGWLLPGLLAGLQVMKQEHIDVIYSTGGPWTAHVIGMLLKRITRKALVTEFRDPWMTNPFRTEYSRIKDYLDSYLERKVIETSDLVIATTVELMTELIGRYPKEPAAKFISLSNGFDVDDLSGVEEKARREAGRFVITHTGFLYGNRDPKNFLDATEYLISNKLIDGNKIRVCLVGSINLNYDLEGYIRSKKLDEVVILKDHIAYKESVAYLKASDALLLLQPGTTTQVPSKVFDYIGIGRPILAVTPRDGATSNVIITEGLGCVADSSDVLEISNAMKRMYDEWSKGELTADVHRDTYKKFDVENITTTLVKELARLAR